MSPTKKGQSGQSEITNEMLGCMIRAALRQEHAGRRVPFKRIAWITGIPHSTVGKWYKHKYTPKPKQLFMLGAHYPSILQLICECMGLGFLWQEAVRVGLVEAMRTRLKAKCKNREKLSMERDKFVHIHVTVDAWVAMQLNQRQLWFLGQLQQGYIMHAENLVDTWQVHTKTARRDITGLLRAGLIQPMQRCRPRCYSVV